jgi:AraC-like DNA-binding protein
MSISQEYLKKAKSLVGDITAADLRDVECYIAENMSLFIPSTGFCQYAIKTSHTHPAYSFVMFFSKEQSFIKQRIYLPEEHYLAAAISPDIPHEEEVSDQFTRYIAIFISKEVFERVYKQIYRNESVKRLFWEQFSIPQEIMIYIRKFMSEVENKTSGYQKVLEALSTLISHCLIRELFKVDMNAKFTNYKFGIDRILEYMHQHYRDRITIEDLAQKSNASPSHFIRNFKKETGLSPIDYLIKLRIKKSQKLIMIGTMNMTEISHTCGFGSTSHFSSSFSKVVGISPKQYKNMYGKK